MRTEEKPVWFASSDLTALELAWTSPHLLAVDVHPHRTPRVHPVVGSLHRQPTTKSRQGHRKTKQTHIPTKPFHSDARTGYRLWRAWKSMIFCCAKQTPASACIVSVGSTSKCSSLSSGNTSPSNGLTHRSAEHTPVCVRSMPASVSLLRDTCWSGKLQSDSV